MKFDAAFVVVLVVVVVVVVVVVFTCETVLTSHLSTFCRHKPQSRDKHDFRGHKKASTKRIH